jgi:hypothetical protein
MLTFKIQRFQKSSDLLAISKRKKNCNFLKRNSQTIHFLGFDLKLHCFFTKSQMEQHIEFTGPYIKPYNK